LRVIENLSQLKIRPPSSINRIKPYTNGGFNDTTGPKQD